MKFGEKKQSNSPFTAYVEWAAGEKKGYFEYWNGEERVEFKLEEALVLEVCYMIKGYDADKECQIYSNKIPYFGAELTVISKDRGVIGKGIWKDIKNQVVKIGGKAHLVMHALVRGEIVQIAFKGAGFAVISEFIKKFNINKNKIRYTGSKDEKKGSIKYKTPVFEAGPAITDTDTVAGMNAVKELDDYEERRKQKADAEVEEEVEKEEEKVDDIKAEEMIF